MALRGWRSGCSARSPWHRSPTGGRRRSPRATRGDRGAACSATSLSEAVEAGGPRAALVAHAPAERSGSQRSSSAWRRGGRSGTTRTRSGSGRKSRGVPLAAGGRVGDDGAAGVGVAGRMTRRPALRVPLAAGALTAWDVFLDPRMVREGYWSWPGGGRYEGVPAIELRGLVAHGRSRSSRVWSLVDGDDDASPTAAPWRCTSGRGWARRGERRRLAAAARGASRAALAMGAFARAGAAGAGRR